MREEGFIEEKTERRMKGLVKAVLRILPENRIKNAVRETYNEMEHSEIFHRTACLRLLDLEISPEGVILMNPVNSLMFYGYLPKSSHNICA